MKPLPDAVREGAKSEDIGVRVEDESVLCRDALRAEHLRDDVFDHRINARPSWSWSGQR